MGRVFVAIGASIILGLLIFSVIAENCTTCCDGEPCSVELREKLLPGV